MKRIVAHQSGMALFQVLLLSALLMVVMLSISLSAKNHVAVARAVQDRTEANLELYSQQNNLVFELLTNPWSMSAASDSSGNSVSIRSLWNFYDQPFVFGTASHQIQDVHGLINLNAPDSKLWRSLTLQWYNQESLGQKIVDSISDWQDSDNIALLLGAEQAHYPDSVKVRNAPIQFESELLLIKNVPEDFYQRAADWLTTYPVSRVHLLNMPLPMLKFYFGDDLTNQVLAQRESRKISATVLSTVSGLEEDDFRSFGSGPVFRIRSEITKGKISLFKQQTLILDPYSRDPIKVWDQRNTKNNNGYVDAE